MNATINLVGSHVVTNKNDAYYHETIREVAYRCGSISRFIVDLRPLGPRFNPGQVDYVYQTVLVH